MAAVGQKVDTNQLAMLMLSKVPPSYKGLRITLTSRERSRPLPFVCGTIPSDAANSGKMMLCEDPESNKKRAGLSPTCPHPFVI